MLGVLQSKLVLKLKTWEVIFNQSLSMQPHVNTVARVYFMYLSKIARIRRFLDKRDYKKIVHGYL